MQTEVRASAAPLTAISAHRDNTQKHAETRLRPRLNPNGQGAPSRHAVTSPRPRRGGGRPCAASRAPSTAPGTPPRRRADTRHDLGPLRLALWEEVAEADLGGCGDVRISGALALNLTPDSAHEGCLPCFPRNQIYLN